MKSMKKAVVLLLCVGAIAAASVFGTMAYLTDTEQAVNTFTVGNVGIDLDEADVSTDGTEIENASRVKENEYHLLPGHTYVKDPTVTVDAGSEAAYVRMLVTVENIDKLEAAIPDSGETTKYYATDDKGQSVFLLQMLCVDEDGNNTWNNEKWLYEGYECKTEQAADDDGTYVEIQKGIYEFRYKDIVTKSATETKLDPLFETITVPGEVDNEGIAHLASVKINVTAHAIQADGFDDAEDAWKAFKE